MTVRVTKDKINVREKLSELDKPTGQAGLEMLAADTPTEQFELINAGRTNLLINGNFDFWQRDTTKALNAGTSGNLEADYLADRWVTDARHADCTVSRQAFTLGQKDVPNARYFIRHTVSNITNPTDYYVHLDQRVEDLRRFDGEDVVLSFYAKASAPTSIGFEFTSRVSLVPSVEYTGTDHAPYNKGDIPLNTEWKKYYIKVTTKGLAGETLLDDHRFTVRFVPSTGTSYATNRWGGAPGFTGDIDIAQVQLEYGSVETPFEHRSYAEELALCQRYYQRLNKGRLGGVINGSGIGIVTNQVIRPYMRVEPTSSITGTIPFYYMYGSLQNTTTVSSLTVTSGYTFNINKADGNTGDGLSFWCDLSSTQYISFDAEL